MKHWAACLLVGCAAISAAILGAAARDEAAAEPREMEQLEQQLKAMAPHEAHYWCLTELQKLADDPGAQPQRTVFLMRGLPEYEDPPDIALLRKVLRKARNDEVRVECVRSLGEFIADPEVVRNDVIKLLVGLLADQRPEIRMVAAQALSRSGDMRLAAKLTPLLDDTDGHVRFTAARAICYMLDWHEPSLTREQTDPWVQSVKARLVPVMKALEAFLTAAKSESERLR